MHTSSRPRAARILLGLLLAQGALLIAANPPTQRVSAAAGYVFKVQEVTRGGTNGTGQMKLSATLPAEASSRDVVVTIIGKYGDKTTTNREPKDAKTVTYIYSGLADGNYSVSVKVYPPSHASTYYESPTFGFEVKELTTQQSKDYSVRLASSDATKNSVTLKVKWGAYPFARTISQCTASTSQINATGGSKGGACLMLGGELAVINTGTKAGEKDVVVTADGAKRPLGDYMYFFSAKDINGTQLFTNKDTPFTYEIKGGDCRLHKPTYDAANKKVEINFIAVSMGTVVLTVDGKEKERWKATMPGGSMTETHKFVLSGVDDAKDHNAEATHTDAFTQKKCTKQVTFKFPTDGAAQEDLVAQAGPTLESATKDGEDIEIVVNFKDGSKLQGKGYTLAGTFVEEKGDATPTDASPAYDGAASVKMKIGGATRNDTKYDVNVALKDASGKEVWKQSKSLTVDKDGKSVETPGSGDPNDPNAGGNGDKNDTTQKDCPMGQKRTASGFCEAPSGTYMPKFGSFGELFDAVRGLVGRLTIYLAVIFLVIAGYYWLTARGEETQIKEAKNSLMGITIGLLIVGISSTAVTTIAKSLTEGQDLDKVAEAFWAGTLKPIVNFLTVFSLGWAVLLFVFAGLRMVGSGGKPEEITKARKTFLYGMGGLLVIGIAESAVAIFGGKGVEKELVDIAKDDNASALAKSLATDLFNPIMTFVVSLIGSIALAMLVKGGYDFLTAAGDDTKVKTAKTELQYSIVGLVVIGLAEVSVKTIFHIEKRRLQVDTAGAVDLIISIINWGLSFLGAIALLMYVYAGFLFLTDAGDGGRKKKGQEILTYTTVGILVILFSYAIVNIFLTGGKAYG